MTAVKKVQQEMDRTLKLIARGVKDFDGHLMAVAAAEVSDCCLSLPSLLFFSLAASIC